MCAHVRIHVRTSRISCWSKCLNALCNCKLFSCWYYLLLWVHTSPFQSLVMSGKVNFWHTINTRRGPVTGSNESRLGRGGSGYRSRSGDRIAVVMVYLFFSQWNAGRPLPLPCKRSFQSIILWSFDVCVIWDTGNVDVKTNDKVKQEPRFSTSSLTITVLFVGYGGAAPLIMESQWPLCIGLLC
jgi:hypothetical protein